MYGEFQKDGLNFFGRFLPVGHFVIDLPLCKGDSGKEKADIEIFAKFDIGYHADIKTRSAQRLHYQNTVVLDEARMRGEAIIGGIVAERDTKIVATLKIIIVKITPLGARRLRGDKNGEQQGAKCA